MNQREIVLKFIKTVPSKKELANIHLEELSRIPNIGENIHYDVSGFKYDFPTKGKVVKIETILYPRLEVIEITIDISK